MIRYEVIYKNSLRDFRKFFSKEFNKFSEWPNSRDPQVILNALKVFIRRIFSKDLHHKHGVTEDEVAFSLGALIKPKQMINSLHSQSNGIKAAQVLKIYFFLYKFSL